MTKQAKIRTIGSAPENKILFVIMEDGGIFAAQKVKGEWSVGIESKSDVLSSCTISRIQTPKYWIDIPSMDDIKKKVTR